jgi:Uma2 family endonuclease
MTTSNYFRGRETNRRRELVFGVVREPPAPYFFHQELVTRLAALLHGYVRDRSLGKICVSPVDVVLDRDRALVVQPDVVFVSTARLSLIDRRIWGAPDLVVEVLSPGTARRDRTTKLRWYRRYGVRECWLVDPIGREIVVISLGRPGRVRRRRFGGQARVQSDVLPDVRLSAEQVFDDPAATI